MAKLVSWCVSSLFFAALAAASAAEDPPPRVRQLCDPTLPENADICVPDTFEVVFGTDKKSTDIADPVWLVSELVRQGPAAKCQDAADANDDGRMDLSDVMYLIDWQFRSQSAPSAPGPLDCGAAPIADTLSCHAGSTDHCP